MLNNSISGIGDYKYIWLHYVTLFLVICWDPLRSYIFTSQGSGYFLLIFVVISFIYEAKYKYFWKKILKEPYVLWFLWVIYALINTFYLHTYNSYADLSEWTFIFGVILPLLLLLIIANSNYNIVQINNVFIWAFFFRILLSLIFDTFDFRTDENIGRLGETFNPNLISHGALFLISCIGLKKVLTDKLSIINYFQFFLAVYTIFLAASRSTAISLVILFTGIIFIVISTSKSMLTRYVILLMIALFLPATVYILNNTGVGVRLVDAYYSTIYAPSQEAMFDNRLWQYIHGLDLFKENPILGIGLNNFINTGRIHIVAHSEYIVQLAECGLIGFFLWLIFYKTIVVRLIKVRSMSSEHRNISNYFITFIVSMLFLMSSTPFYSKEEFWVILALIIKYTETSMSFIDNTAPTDNIIA